MLTRGISKSEHVSGAKTNSEINETLEGLPKKLEKEQVGELIKKYLYEHYKNFLKDRMNDGQDIRRSSETPILETKSKDNKEMDNRSFKQKSDDQSENPELKSASIHNLASDEHSSASLNTGNVSITEDFTDSKEEPEQISSGAEINKTKESSEKLEKEQVSDDWICGLVEMCVNNAIDLSLGDKNDYQQARYSLVKKFLLPKYTLGKRNKNGYTKVKSPPFRSYNEPPSLMDSKCSLSGQVFVWFALEHGLTESQRKLDKKLLDALGELAFDHGLNFDYTESLEKFLQNNKNNPDLKAILNIKRGESGSTILHAIAGADVSGFRPSGYRAIDLLLEAGADPNIQNDEGETPLHRASAMGYRENICSLLRGNADPNICDGQGKTPQKIAVDNHNYHVKSCFFTDNQKKLREKLNNVLRKDRYKEGNLGYTVTLTLDQLLEDLKKFLHKHKGNQDLKVVLNIRGIAGELEVLKYVRGAFPDSQDANKIKKLLLEAGAEEFDYNIKKLPESGVFWNNLESPQKNKLVRFLGEVSEAQNMTQLKKIVDKVITFGVRLNYRQSLLPQHPFYSFTDYVIKRISELEKDPKVASYIVCQLVSNGAVFGDEANICVFDELELECKNHKANIIKAFEGYIKNAHEFIKVAKSATTSKLNDIKLGNAIFQLEYSEDSKIDIAQITDGIKSLGLAHKDSQYERNIIRIGESEVEIITQNGKRHYTDLIGNIVSTFSYTNSEGKLEELEVNLYSNKQGRIKVEVSNKEEVLEKFKNCKEELGKNCLFGVHSVYNAIELGYFEKPGKSFLSSGIAQGEKLQSGKVSFADQVRRTSANEAANISH